MTSLRSPAAIDDAIAANPEVAAKIAGGKTAAVGVLVGAVMKATRGQADAGRVRELILPPPQLLSPAEAAHGGSPIARLSPITVAVCAAMAAISRD